MFLLILAVADPCALFAGGGGDLHIAVVCPLSGRNAANGKSVVEGARLYFDQVNRDGGVQGRNIVLDFYDDGDDAGEAEKRAREIAEVNRALVVLGHESSACSMRGGAVYKEHGIPAVTPTSTDVRVTQGNPWYFRMTFNNDFQGRYLANYIRNVFEPERVSIIHEDLAYGAKLSEVFRKTSEGLGMSVPHVWEYEVKEASLERRLAGIVGALKEAGEEAGVVFLAVHPPEGFLIITHLRDMGVENPIVFAAGLSSPGFLKQFNRLPGESQNPGYYTDGMYAASGVIFDTAGEAVQDFMVSFRNAYDGEPNRRAAFSYDAAKMIYQALLGAGIAGSTPELGPDREKIRAWLASRDAPFNAVEGVTGRTYFNEDGDPAKPISMGMFKNQTLISAPVQFQEVRATGDIPDVKKALVEGRVIQVDGRHMYKTNVVYTGIKLNRISDVDVVSQTFKADFHLWFRYHGDVDPQNILFLGAASPVEVGPLEKEMRTERMVYQRYRVRGTFMMNTVSGIRMHDEHVLNIGFRHRELPRFNLVYVTDLLGMGTTESLQKKVETTRVLNPAEGWAVSRISFLQGIEETESLGHPDHLSIQSGIVDYSKFNIGVRIKKMELRFRRNVSLQVAYYMMGVALLALFTGFLPGLNRGVFVASQVGSVSALLVCGEVIFLKWFLERGESLYLQAVIRVFDILWWVLPAHFLIQCIEWFIWTPLETRTNRSIPNLVRRFVAFFIWMLVFFGILAFVFDRKITSLLATSGVITMIIGLAIQVNIANIFSGIAINLERPFQIGDWIKINELSEGKVTDITWRTTRIWTSDNNMVNIPNSMASEAVIVNFNRPDGASRVDLNIHVATCHSPEKVEGILRKSMLSVEGVERVDVHFHFNDWSSLYTASFFVRDHVKNHGFQHMVSKKIWEGLMAAKIEPLHPETRPRVL